MASPFGHAAVGLATASVVARSMETPFTLSLWLIAVVAAGAPDLDLVLSWFGKSGPRYHRNASHSLFVLGGAILAVWFTFGVSMPVQAHGLFWAGSVSLLSHPILDVITTGPGLARRGYGIAVFWPIGRRRFWVRRPIVNTPEFDACENVSDVMAQLKPEVLRLGPPTAAVLLAAMFL